ncbi:MAG: pyridoxal-phosphate dependent enzyme [Myxococcota bacterium]|nr:pyridoxal-phosphate dependent enzyme [Myxococcota bacterium]
MTVYAADLNAIKAAARRIEGHANTTPVLTCQTLNEMTGRSLYFKCENFQKVGAFKFRGAMNATSRQIGIRKPDAFVTHSSGNHAQALALAAKVHGIPAHIVMPTNAPEIKRKAVESYGATIHPCEPNLPERVRVADAVCQQTDGFLIPPYDHEDIIAGQGTVGLELFEQAGRLDAVICPVGGGGLLSGVALAYRDLDPLCHVLAAEPFGADDAFQSKKQNRLVPQTSPDTIADGLRTSLGHLTWPIVRDLVPRIYRVTDRETRQAMRLIWERMKIIVEPSAAIVLAAVMAEDFDPERTYGRIGLVLSGGNLDLDTVSW